LISTIIIAGSTAAQEEAAMESAREMARELWALDPVRAGLIILATLVVSLIIDIVLRKLVSRLTQTTRSDLDDRLIRILRRPVFLTVLIVGFYSALAVMKPPVAVLGFAASFAQTLAILIWLFAGLRVCSALLDTLSHLAGRVAWLDERTVPLFDNFAKIVVFGGAVYCLLMAWDLDVKPWLASAGILGIAIGFAAKDSLANLFGGISIIVDAPYKLGDWINLNSGERGRVTKIGLRSTRLLTRDDVEVTLPNAQIANSTIVNESGGPWEKARVEIRVGVAYGSDIDRVRQVLMQSACECEYAAKDPEPRIRFLEMGDSALIFRVMCWVEEPVQRGRCIDALNTGVYKRLVAEGITIPFPQRELHIRQPSSTVGQ
jgi:MscS family membrane protein